MAISQDFTQRLAAAIRGHEPLPEFPSGLSMEEAYENLTAVASTVCDQTVAGIKAGLTSAQVQEFFGLHEPLVGYLYDWGQSQSGATIPLESHGQIECEIGIVLDETGNPITLAPAIEFVKLNFSKPEDFSPANLIMTSLGADRFILGDQLAWTQGTLDSLDDVTITLKKDGEEMLRTTPNDSLDGPRNAVTWCVSEARKWGILPPQGGILLAGTCGSGLPLETGQYIADYGVLGSIHFEVR